MPLAYEGDALGQLTGAKTVATGEVDPFFPKYPRSFGAPFVANWNDYPNTDELGLAWTGLLAAVFGVFTGSTISVLSGHILAAASFYYVCRKLRYPPLFSAVTAVLFGLSPYAFGRGLGHLTLTYYWHVPLGILAVYYALRSAPTLPPWRQIAFCAGAALLHAFQNPYYAGILIQFLLGAAAYQLARRGGWPRVLFPVALACIVVFGGVFANLDSFFHRQSYGPNPASIVRNYAGLELYALKPLELVLPPLHRLDDIRRWVMQNYTSQAYVVGEIGATYIGVIGVLGLLLLASRALRHWAAPRLGNVPHELWFIGWVLLYSVPGGVNGLIGTTGFVFFRATNRYSIVILAFVLLFLARYLGAVTRRYSNGSRFALASLVLGLGLWDQTPPQASPQQLAAKRAIVVDDAALVAQIESVLPAGSMIFQLPVMDFPEVPPYLGVADYEHFRPYLHSRSLRFSYGSNKGRPREQWQHELAPWGHGAVAELERYGFAAVLINVKGYDDRGAALLHDLAEAGRARVIAKSQDFVAVRLWPAEHPVAPPSFGRGWYPAERTPDRSWRWSSGDATITLYNLYEQESRVRLRFGLQSNQARNVSVSVGGARLYEARLEHGRTVPVDLTVSLPPGATELHISSDTPALPPPNGDPRLMAVGLVDFVQTAPE